MSARFVPVCLAPGTNGRSDILWINPAHIISYGTPPTQTYYSTGPAYPDNANTVLKLAEGENVATLYLTETPTQVTALLENP